MKRIFTILLTAALLCTALAGCGKRETPPADSASPEKNTESDGPDSGQQNISADSPADPSENPSENRSEDRMYIHIGKHTLNVKMADNSSAEALLALLKKGDISVAAHDYGSFEKVGSLGTELPTNDERITTAPGDVILYQGDQITVYYDTNSWSFTRLGKVQGVTADELRAILGDGDVTMVLSLDGRDGRAADG